MKITNPITLDVARSNSYICLLAKQFDENSRFLIATLTNNGKPMIIPAGATVTLRATRPDGEPVAVPGIINNDGTTTVEIDDYILEVVGSASLSIEVAIGDEILTSASFNLTIQRADGNGWLRVYVAAASFAAGNYYITIGDTPYAFTTTQAIPAGGSVYFASEGGTAQTRDASGNVLDASLPVSIASTGTELTSDVPTMSFLTAIAGRMATIEAEMSQKANIDGSYPLLNAGSADNLMTDNGATQAIPFIQEGTGKGNGEATVKAGGILQLKKKLGNTVGVNQLQKNGNFANTSDWTASNGVLTVSGNVGTFASSSSSNKYLAGAQISFVANHKYLLSFDYISDNSFTFQKVDGNVSCTASNSFVNKVLIDSRATDSTRSLMFYDYSGSASWTLQLRNVICIDLTLWYGSNDRIPSDLLSHPENWGRYYAGSLDYNAGTLESADGTVMRSIGRNVWDESTYTDTHRYIDISGLILNHTYCITQTENQAITYGFKIAPAWWDADEWWSDRTLSGATFTLTQRLKDVGKLWIINSSETDVLTVAQVESAKICLSLYYPGESGYDQYYPYSVLAEVDTGSEVLRSAGSVADEKTPDGTITRRVGAITFDGSADEGWTVYGGNRYYINVPDFSSPATNVKANLTTNYATPTTKAWLPSSYDGTAYISGSDAGYHQLLVNLGAFSSASELKTYLASKPLTVYYELATPTTEQGTAFAENIPCDDFGSLMWTQTKGIPQGNEIFYPADLKGALESIVAALPSADGTYTLKATISGGVVTYSWS